MTRNFLNVILYLCFVCFLFSSSCKAQPRQEYWVNKFDSTFYHTDSPSSYNRYKELANSQNALTFISLSYGVNALTIMYETTGNMRYLEANRNLIQSVIDTAIDLPLDWKYQPKGKSHKPVKQSTYKGWKVTSVRARARLKGRDVMLYEGYLYRYVMQYLYLLKREKIIESHPEYRNHYQEVLAYVEENIWSKWQKRSMLERGDYSKFFMKRTHMGSHWAAMALYLEELTDESAHKEVYRQVIVRYNELLRNNFRIETNDGQSFYIWHATYDELPGKDSQGIYITETKDNIIQDVTHGNQVVSYILEAVKLNSNEWNKEDVKKLINTVKFSTWNENDKTFYDHLKPSDKVIDGLEGTGYKQADGWLKLAQYDVALLDLYEKFYKHNIRKIDSTHKAAQVYAQMANNYMNK